MLWRSGARVLSARVLSARAAPSPAARRAFGCACPGSGGVSGGSGTGGPTSISETFRKVLSEDDAELSHLLDNNRRWVDKQNAADPDFFTHLGGGQAPTYLYIGCSDSRVPANEILGLPAGEVFVHRNVGNLVVNTDLNAASVIEYAVEHLDVKHIIVTGHYDCGAVKASVEKQDLGMLENWLRNIRDVHRTHFQALHEITDLEAKHRRLVELNVIEQCLNLYKTGVVQRKRLKTFEEGPHAYPRVHGLVFDPKDGILKRLPVHFKDEIGEMGREVYDLY